MSTEKGIIRGCPANATRDEIVVNAVQRFVDRENPREVRVQLEEDLRTHFAPIADVNPQKAAITVAKFTHSAVRGAYLHGVGEIFIRNTLPYLREGRSLVPDELPQRKFHSFRSPDLNPFADPYQTFMNANFYWWDGASTELLTMIENNPSHPSALLLDELVETLSGYYNIWNQTEGPTKDQLIKTILKSGEVNAEIVMDTLIARDMAADEGATSTEVTQRALADAGTLSQAATVNRKVIFDMFRFPNGYFPCQENGTIDERAYREYGKVFEEGDDKRVSYRHPSLRNGQWRVPRACVGRLPAKSFEEDDQANTRKFFNLAEAKAEAPIIAVNDGTFDNVALLTVAGAYIGEETIFRARRR